MKICSKCNHERIGFMKCNAPPSSCRCLCIYKTIEYSKKSPPIPTSQPDDTMFYSCPRCGDNTQLISGKQYCPICKIYL